MSSGSRTSSSTSSRKSSSTSSRKSLSNPPSLERVPKEGPEYLIISQELVIDDNERGFYKTKLNRAIEKQFAELAKKINSYIAVGYEPQGTIFQIKETRESGTLYQAMF